MKNNLKNIDALTQTYIESTFSQAKEKKWTFSKILVISISIATLLVTIFACVAMWYFNNIDALMYLIPAIFTECATVTGFYSYKAKAENEIKLDTQRQVVTSFLDRESIKENDEEGVG